jgi:hypothetical protein
MEHDPAHVIWQRTLVGDVTYGPWEAKLESAGRVCFATIGKCVDGRRWSVTLFPKGWTRHSWHFYCHSDAKAKAMIERWARYHWRSVLPKEQRGPGGFGKDV